MLDRIPESDAGRLAIPAREATAETIREDQAPAETLEQSIAAPDREERQPPPAPTEPVARVQVTDTGNPAAKVVAEPEVEGAVRPDVEELVARQARVRPDSVLTAPRARLQVLQGQGLALEEEARRKTPGEVADSASSEGGSLIGPGLEVLSMKWEEWFPGERALHIRQLLPNRDTLELRYVGMLIGTDPAGQPRFVRGVLQENLPKDKPLSPVVMQASLPPGWNQVVTPLERGWLVARAPLPEATIMALVNFIH
jgi:hypothetical protein